MDRVGLNRPGASPWSARLVVAAALAVVAGLCWWLLAESAAMMASMRGDGALLVLATAMMEPGAIVPYLVASTLMWIAMMGAMMAPAALPITLVFLRLDRERRIRMAAFGRGTASARGLLFAGGYLTTWALFAVLATLLQWRLHRAALLHSDVLVVARPLAGVLLIVAGLYQLTPLKTACLRRCRSPMGFLLSHWRDGDVGAFSMGMEHGAACLGCCWALMLLMFAAGVMSLTAMVALSVFILAERLLPGRWAAQVPGAALVVWGVWTLLRLLG